MKRDPNLAKFNETRTDDNRMAGKKINVEMGNKERKKIILHVLMKAQDWEL